MLTIGIVLGALDFRVAALFAQFLSDCRPMRRWSSICVRARAAGFPLSLRVRACALPSRSFFAAQSFELLRPSSVALQSERCRFVLDRSFLLAQGGFAAIKLGAFFREASCNRFGRGEPFVAEPPARRGRRRVRPVRIALSREVAQAFRPVACVRLRLRRGSWPRLRARLSRAPHVCVRLRDSWRSAREIVLANRQFEAEARQFALRLLVACVARETSRSASRCLSVAASSDCFGVAKSAAMRVQCPPAFSAISCFELRNFGVERAQFALHSERAGFVRAATGDHAALVAGAVGRHERVLRIFACQVFRRRSGCPSDMRREGAAEIALPPAQADRGIRRACPGARYTPSSARKGMIGSYSLIGRFLRSESTKNVARPPTSSRSM